MKETREVTEALDRLRREGRLIERGPAAPEPLPEPSISEKEWMHRVIAFAESHGWRYYHVLYAQGSAAGFPDLVMLRPGQVVVAELKTDKGRTTREQESWLTSWRVAGARAEVWRPCDWERVKEILT